MQKINDLFKTFVIKFSPVLLVIIFLLYAITEINSATAEAKYAYPRAVAVYGLAGAKTDEEITAAVEQWKRDGWGAQIGAMRVLCGGDRAFVDQLGGANVGAKLCRTVQ